MTQTIVMTGQLRYGVDGLLEQQRHGPDGEVWIKVPSFAPTTQGAAPCVGGGVSGVDPGHVEPLRSALEQLSGGIPNMGLGGPSVRESDTLRSANAKLQEQISLLKQDLEAREKIIDNLRGASRDVPIRSMSEDDVRRHVLLAQVDLAEALRHIAEAGLARGGSDDPVAVATRARLSVARAAAHLDGEPWTPPRDMKG